MYNIIQYCVFDTKYFCNFYYYFKLMLFQKRTIEAGTTTACYFASLYTEASAILAEKVAELGQRAFIGKINMNIPRNDEYYESTEKSIKDTIAFVESVERIGVSVRNLYFISCIKQQFSNCINRKFYIIIT